MLEVVVTAEAIGRAKLQSNHYHHQTSTKSFLQAGSLPVAQPTVSKHWRENITSYGLAYPKLTWVFQLCLWPLIAPGYLGEVCHASHQPSDASIPIY